MVVHDAEIVENNIEQINVEKKDGRRLCRSMMILFFCFVHFYFLQAKKSSAKFMI